MIDSLAILGEASVLANAQVSSLSQFIFLPRLLPAPQALIRVERPERLEPYTGKLVGSHSGNIKNELNHVAHILHNDESLEAYSVKCVRLTKNPNAKKVKASLNGPLTWLSLIGCGMSVALTVLSIKKEDGMALIATILLSCLSTLIGIGSKWHLELPERKVDRFVPSSDVIIRYPQGSFLVVQCDEAVQRELYWAKEKCNYMVGIQTYRLISLVGTLMLMFGVIFLANAQLPLQLAYAAAYILLNAAYWVVAALPPRLHWDLSKYHVQEIEYDVEDHGEKVKLDEERDKNYTEALWTTIAITQSVGWARNADIAPKAKAWGDWLDKAEEMAGLPVQKRDPKTQRLTLPYWDCQTALSDYLKVDAAAMNV